MKVNLKGLCSFIFLFLLCTATAQAQSTILSTEPVISLMLMEGYTTARNNYKDICGTEVAPSACDGCRATPLTQEKCNKYRNLCGNVSENTCERINNQTLLVLLNYEAFCGDTTPDACQAGACSAEATASDEIRRNNCPTFISAYREKCNNETSAACRVRLMRPRPTLDAGVTGTTIVDPGALATAPVVPRETNDQQVQAQQEPRQDGGGGGQPAQDNNTLGGGGGGATDEPKSGPCSLLHFAGNGSWLGNAWLGLALLAPLSLRMRKKR